MGGEGSSFRRYMANAEFKINKPNLLIEACAAIDRMRVGSQNQDVEQITDCVDPRVQWSEASNVWHNAAIRTALYMPVRALRNLFQK